MRRSVVLLVVVLMVVGVVVSPVTASPDDKPVGERINVFSGAPATFAAGEPFFVAHGWSQDPSEENSHPVGKFDFRLDIDGDDQGKGQLLNYGVGVDSELNPFAEDALIRTFLFNFDDGLPAGTYTFTGHWFQPCTAAGALPCDKPNEAVEVFTRTLEVTFQP